MSAPETLFQDAVLERLRADPAVRAVLGDPARVFDRAPAGSAFPFLAFGASESEPESGADAALIVHRLTLSVWDRYGDLSSVKQVAAPVRAALDGADLTLTGPWRCVTCRVVLTDSVRGPDGRTARALIRLRAVLEAIE